MKLVVLSFLLVLCRSAAVAQQSDAMPDPKQLKERTIANVAVSRKALENYSCIVHRQSTELNGDGSVKEQRKTTVEEFFINGVRIGHVLTRDGKDLTGDDAKKEQARVDKQVHKYSDVKQVEKRQSEDEQHMDTLLRCLKFTNGHRELRNGRRTDVYDLTGDPDYKPRSLEERFAQALTGRIWVDEDSGAIAEVRVHTDKDVKIGGGLLANVHKGFQVHIIQQHEADGAWISKLAEGSGDARAALFLHPRFQFREELDKCHLFSVNTQTEIQKPASPAGTKP